MPAGSRVLVIEDDEPLRELVAILLADEGYRVRTAPAGREALSSLHEWRPHLIVLDLRMRDMDGWAFRAAQRQTRFADVPVLILTATCNPERHAEGLAAPILTKPFQLHDLLAYVEGLLNQASPG